METAVAPDPNTLARYCFLVFCVSDEDAAITENTDASPADIVDPIVFSDESASVLPGNFQLLRLNISKTEVVSH